MYKRYLQKFSLDEQSRQYDVVVVGAGVAGLFASLTLDPEKKILIIAKEGLRDCNSDLAQGGIAITLDGDYDSHIQDTLKAGSFYNDSDVVAKMIGMSRSVFDELMAMDANFDKNDDGSISMTAEGGHRKRRIIHVKDTTGEAVMTTLLNEIAKRDNIELLTQTTALELITDSSEVVGVAIQTAGQPIETLYCANVILATGGIGGLFESTTNVSANTGDGMALAVRAGAVLRDSEFIQYHPTAMKMKQGGYFLISEAVRGEGGYLINDLGVRFMEHQHEMKELAPRDVVAKAINDQILLGHQVYVDVRHFPEETFQKRFPNIYGTCLSNGVDPLKEPIPITPVEHYYMGGISCTVDGEVLGVDGQVIKGLFASGEAACTGFHGANRLASNSLLECLTLSKRVTDLINLQKTKTDSKSLLSHLPQLPEITDERLGVISTLFKQEFSEVFTIVKNKKSLERALVHFEEWLRELNQYQSRSSQYEAVYNGLMVAREIALGSLKREASLGAFILADAKDN